jgi:MoCo/4Fe-4S cofactor protein with predicted Tat translocation signal
MSDGSRPKTDSEPRYWRSLEQRERVGVEDPSARDEFVPGASELVLDPVGRRDFLGVMGASVAMASTTLAGCVRKPKEKILPYTNRPEDLIPGKPQSYATAAQIAGKVLGLLVESQDGRPTKIDGNPDHPASQGATDVFAQATVLDLYAPNRPRAPRVADKEVSLEALDAQLQELRAAWRVKKGAGLALLLQSVRSPTFHALLAQLREQLPEARIYLHDATHPAQADAGAARVGAAGLRQMVDFERAERILALDADPFGIEGDTVRQARGFARGRRVDQVDDRPNRLYVVEPTFTVTGMNADNRLRLAASQIGEFLADIVAKLAKDLLKTFPADMAPLLKELLERAPAPAGPWGDWVEKVSKDLAQHRSVVVVGERQPAEVHALAHLANQLLRSAANNVVRFVPDTLQLSAEPLAKLASAIRAGQVETLIIFDGNPVYDAPADFDCATLLQRVATTIHLCSEENETSALARWVIPSSHFLESWGDLQTVDGVLSVQQPLIAPLHQSLSPLELMARLAGSETKDGYSLVRAHWQRLLADLNATAGQPFEKVWRRTVHDGVLTRWDKSGREREPFVSPTAVPQYQWSELVGVWRGPRKAGPTSGRLELIYQLDNTVLDGRFASNAWLQELPDPVTKLTWDNALLVGVETAKALELQSEQVYRLETDGRAIDVVPFVTPGLADNCLVLPLGYGRSSEGAVEKERGFNAYQLRQSGKLGWQRGAKLKKLRGHYKLATTQEHGSMVEPTLMGREGNKRPVVQETTLKVFRDDPNFARRGELQFDKQLLPDERPQLALGSTQPARRPAMGDDDRPGQLHRL